MQLANFLDLIIVAFTFLEQIVFTIPPYILLIKTLHINYQSLPHAIVYEQRY